MALSWSVNEESDSIALIEAIRSDLTIVLVGGGAIGLSQSGQSQPSVAAAAADDDDDVSRVRRQVRCQGVTQVLQVIISSVVGLLLQTIQLPSPSQGSCCCAIWIWIWMDEWMGMG